MFKSWLDAGGDRNLVKDSIKDWLAKPDNVDHPELDFLIRSWIEARGNFSLVKEPACRWLAKNRENYEAVYCTKHLARQRELPEETILHILEWCNCFHQDHDSIYRLGQLGLHLQNDKISLEALKVFGRALPHVLEYGVQQSLVLRTYILGIFTNLGYASSLDEPNSRHTLLSLFAQWLCTSVSFNSELAKLDLTWLQSPVLIQLLYEALSEKLLQPTTDIDAIQTFITWIDKWQPERKKLVQKQISIIVEKWRLWELESAIDFSGIQ